MFVQEIAEAHVATSAVVFTYQKFGQRDQPAANIRIEQFEAQIKELKSGRYTLTGLPKIIDALRSGRSLPDRTVGISIDGAARSAYAEAWPLLKKAQLPFTLFVTTDTVDRGGANTMTWSQIRELARTGVTIGSRSATYLHMPISRLQRIAADLARSNARFKKELGKTPKLFAYPYGEYGLALRQKIIDAGFVAAFGQHSGVLHKDADFMFLPRFAMNENSGITWFRLAANALPLPVKEVTPADPLLASTNNPPSFGFTVFGDALRDLRSLTCYVSGQGKTRIERLGGRRIEVRMKQPFPVGRARINCTMPAGNGRWRWFGIQFYARGP